MLAPAVLFRTKLRSLARSAAVSNRHLRCLNESSPSGVRYGNPKNSPRWIVRVRRRGMTNGRSATRRRCRHRKNRIVYFRADGQSQLLANVDLFKLVAKDRQEGSRTVIRSLTFGPRISPSQG